MRKLLIFLLSLALTANLVGPSLVLAQEASASAINQQTGSASTNEAANTTSNSAEVNNNNNANATNNTNAELNSGANTASNNTANAAVTTGDAGATVSATTTANTNAVEPMPWTTWTGEGDWTNNYNSANTQTGSNSSNSSTNTANNEATVNNQNNANIINNTNATSVTGNNKASDNTGNATITTGTASFVFDGKNIVNLNGTAIWTGQGDWSNGYNGSVANTQTGSNSTNNASNGASNSTNINNINNANLVNNLQALALSGSNKASDNTGNGSITTGEANLVASLLNLANTNIVGTSTIGLLFKDIFGNSSENVDLGNATYFNTSDLGSTIAGFSSNNQTGSNSTNNSANDLSNILSIDNQNDGDIVNNLDLNAISGNNKTNDNTGDGNITTGDANIMANLINFLNTNILTTNFLFGMINVFGEWSGNLVLPEYQPNSTVQNLASLSAANNLTGSGSENSATNSLNNSLDINNDNQASVNNNLDLNAISGNNNSNDNTLGGSVTSGQSDVKAGANTFANQNIISEKPWWLVLVNNMGSIIPQLVSPDGSVMLFDQFLGLDTLNNQTGSNSDNSSTNDVNNQTTINNQNNGSITNNIKGLANTGGNSASDNTGSGTIKTGNASLLISALNFINTNITTPNLMITFVNVFDKWTGGILSHDQSQVIAPIISSSSGTNTNQNLGTGGLANTLNNDPEDPTPTPSFDTMAISGNQASTENNQTGGTSNINNVKVLSYFDNKDINVIAPTDQLAESTGSQPTSSYTNSSTSANLIQSLMENQVLVWTILVFAFLIGLKKWILNRYQLPFSKRG